MPEVRVSLDPSPAPIPAPAWLTVAEVAAEVQVGRRSVYNAVRAGRLKATAVNERGDLRIHRNWIAAWRSCVVVPAKKTRRGRR